MINFKKIIVSVILFIFSASMLFAFADEYDNVDVIKKIEVSDYYGVSFLLLNLHLEIWRGVSDEKWIFFVVDLLNQMKYYADFDVITYLGYTFDVKYSLDSVIFDLSEVLDRWLSVKTELEKNMVWLMQEKLDCDAAKEISDKSFALALKDFDSKNMELYLQQSLDHENCAWEARIYYNVQDKMLSKIDFYYEVLKNKYTYFRSNRDDIIFNYPKILYNLSRNQ